MVIPRDSEGSRDNNTSTSVSSVDGGSSQPSDNSSEDATNDNSSDPTDSQQNNQSTNVNDVGSELEGESSEIGDDSDERNTAKDQSNQDDSVDRVNKDNFSDQSSQEQSSSVAPDFTDWLDSRLQDNFDYSPLSINGDSKPSVPQHSLGLWEDPGVNVQSGIGNPKQFQTPYEKLANTPPQAGAMSPGDKEQRTILDNFVKSELGGAITEQDIRNLQSDLKSSTPPVVATYDEGNKKETVVLYTDENGQSRIYVAEVDKQGNFKKSFVTDLYSGSGQRPEKQLLTHPVPGAPISGPRGVFGPRINPKTGKAQKLHGGLDFAAPKGTSVRAANSGTVSFAGRMKDFGNFVVIDHGNGTETAYAHLDSIDVKTGEVVSAGKKIGEVGTTGRSTGPHLHFEVREKGRKVDPKPYIYGQ